ncbi:hypothetical protein CBOM_00529 [Ceraceosorus bombacis]|uniref:Uncharacterized protein n=1 Tax=Ceraceosorus bombacis TaxID=401625 RepID=A0A0P1BA09_9BASI|nr:hypothetical protein CBOM_00529 [Ceraceosorus bombacis]
MPVLCLPPPSTVVISGRLTTSNPSVMWRRKVDQNHMVIMDTCFLTFCGVIFIVVVVTAIALMVWTPYRLRRELRRAAKADLERGEMTVQLQTICLAYSERERQVVHVVQENTIVKRKKAELLQKIDVLECKNGKLAQENVNLKRSNGELEAEARAFSSWSPSPHFQPSLSCDCMLQSF